MTKATVILAISTGIGKTNTNHANCLNQRIVLSFAEDKSSLTTVSWVKTNAEKFEGKHRSQQQRQKRKGRRGQKNTLNNNKTIIKRIEFIELETK